MQYVGNIKRSREQTSYMYIIHYIWVTASHAEMDPNHITLDPDQYQNSVPKQGKTVHRKDVIDKQGKKQTGKQKRYNIWI